MRGELFTRTKCGDNWHKIEVLKWNRTLWRSDLPLPSSLWSYKREYRGSWECCQSGRSHTWIWPYPQKKAGEGYEEIQFDQVGSFTYTISYIFSDFSDKTVLLPLMYLQDDPFWGYAETKEVMLAVVKEFYVNCKATSTKLREKHAREMRLLYRMKEQAEHPEQKEKNNEKKTFFDEARKAFWRIVSNVLPPSSNRNAAV